MMSYAWCRMVAVLVALVVLGCGMLHGQNIPNGRDAAVGPADTALVERFEYIERRDSLELNHDSLTAYPRNDTLVRLGNTLPEYCAERKVHAAWFSVKFDRGEEYQYGTNAFDAQVNFDVYAIDTNGNPAFTYSPITLTLDENAPEQLFCIEYTGAALDTFSRVEYWGISVQGYTTSGVTRDVRLIAQFREEYAIGAKKIGAPDTPMVAASEVASPATGNPVYFSWDIPGGCADTFPNYQFQLLRLYNIDTSYKEDTKVRALVDWGQALTIETDGGRREIPLTLAEGTGFYVWRVRPIGSLYEGGIADSRNWGVWSPAPRQDTVLVFTSPADSTLPAWALWYEQFDDDKNWAYARGFTEGFRVAEGMSYATSLGMARQSQARVASTDSVIVAESYYDYSGRAAAGSLAAPVPETAAGFFGYRDTLVKSNGARFGPQHFDEDTNYRDPEKAAGGAISLYWSDNNPDNRIPTADGYPFGRGLATTDGSGRALESGGPGEAFRLGGGHHGKERTGRVYYSAVSNMELVSLFGDEAPADTNVIKVLSTDANKVTQVAWMTSEGTVIATALERHMGDTLLEPLDETVRVHGIIADTVRGARRSGGSTFFSGKRLAFTHDTTLTLSYRVSSRAVRDTICGTPYCTTCDYVVRLIMHNLEQPDSTKEIVLVIPPTSCGSITELDTQLTVRVGPGTYLFERRMETNTVNPATISDTNRFGVPFARHYIDTVGAAIRSVINANSTITQVRALLAAGDLDSLYAYLGADPAEDEYVNITTACCTIRIPILDPDCGEDPCKNGTPDFEKLMFDSLGAGWSGGDTFDLNEYFQTGGITDFYKDSTGYTKGRGAFNAMIANMIAERDSADNPVYSCRTLWAVWRGLIENYPRLASTDGTPANRNPDFDLLGTFLDAVGRRYQGASNTAYDADSGYCTRAYKYIRYTIGDHINCQDASGYNVNWHGEPDSSDGWDRLRRCLRGYAATESGSDDGTIRCFKDASDDDERDECAEDLELALEGPCRKHCEDRYGEFYEAVEKAYADAEESYTNEDIDCIVQGLIDSCRAWCDITLVRGMDGHVDTIGRAAEYDRIRDIYEKAPVVALKGAGACPDTTIPFTGRTTDTRAAFVRYLNNLLAGYRTDSVGIVGGWWNVKAAARALFPSHAALMTDSMVYVRYRDTAATFVLQGVDTCKLVYLADTLVCGTPATPHPMVRHLNAMMNTLWGWEVDTAEDYAQAYSTRFRDSSNYYMHFDYRLDGDTLVDYLSFESELLRQQFSCINGIIELRSTNEFIDTLNDTRYAQGFRLHQSDATNRLTGKLGLKGVLPGNSDVVASTLKRRGYSGSSSMYNLVTIAYSHELGGDYFERVDTTTTGKQEMLRYFDSSYTQLIGYYGQDSAGYLTYRFHFENNDTTARVFGVRFYSYATKTLSEDICTTKACADVCFRWEEREVGTATDTIRLTTCSETVLQKIRAGLEASITACVDNHTRALRTHYERDCSAPDSVDDELILSYPVDYYHFTLYYYDRAGNLVRTVAPKGVTSGYTSRGTHPTQTYADEYAYNSLRQPLWAHTPDGDTARVYYDYLGRVRFTQSRKQLDSGWYSYVKYDALGRTIESGQSSDLGAGGFIAEADSAAFPAFGTERTYVAYDTSSGITYLDSSAPRNLRNRVGAVWNDDTVKTHYSYDEHGNVEWVAQEIPGMGRVNYVRYHYDLISGNMHHVEYNTGRMDAFHHRYAYDADNRLTQVETSRDNKLWENDARYHYRADGSLKRREVGEDRLQGLDYTYTLDGALKGANTPSLVDTLDPGQDGIANTYPADSFAVAMSYYHGDFARTGNPLDSSSATGLRGPPRYGNIAGTATHIGQVTATGKYQGLAAEEYMYDQLGRLKATQFRSFDTTNQDWDTTSEYSTRYSYDPNGNIDTLHRNAYDRGVGLMAMDSLAYHYDDTGSAPTNQLDHVTDAVAGAPYTEDFPSGQAANTYTYDGDGNLVSDASEGGMAIQWDAGGRVKRITRTRGAGAGLRQIVVSYTYDAMGNRVKQVVGDFAVGPKLLTLSTTYWVYDANGIVVAIYEEKCDSIYVPKTKGRERIIAADSAVDHCRWLRVEHPIYGLGREGIARLANPDLDSIPTGNIYTRKLDERRYELRDHLGNARAVLSDRKLSDLNGSGVPEKFRADIRSHANLYPFGQEQPGRYTNSGEYRYGYNGMERDTSGTDGHYTTYFRQYDARLGRWWGIDPVENPSESPYAAMSNNPIALVDPSGARPDSPSVSTVDGAGQDVSSGVTEGAVTAGAPDTPMPYDVNPNTGQPYTKLGWRNKRESNSGGYPIPSPPDILMEPLQGQGIDPWKISLVYRDRGADGGPMDLDIGWGADYFMFYDGKVVGELTVQVSDLQGDPHDYKGRTLPSGVSTRVIFDSTAGTYYGGSGLAPLGQAIFDYGFPGPRGVKMKDAVGFEAFGLIGRPGSPAVRQIARLYAAEMRMPISRVSSEVVQGAVESSPGLMQKFLDRIAEIRQSLKIGKYRNIAFAEGNVNGKEIGEIVGVSGEHTGGVAMPSQRTFGTGVDGHPRHFDSEVFVFEQLNAILKPMGPGAKGVIRLVTERSPCSSCADVVKQFEQRYPNVTVVIYSGP